jgi:hypothetical protein
MLCYLDRPAVPEASGAPGASGAWQVELELDDPRPTG